MKEEKIINEGTPQEVITVTGLADVFAIQAELVIIVRHSGH